MIMNRDANDTIAMLFPYANIYWIIKCHYGQRLDISIEKIK